MSFPRATTAERLRSRRAEIEAALLARVYAVSDPGEVDDPEYAAALRGAVAAALEYALASIEEGETPPSPPPELLSQARLAARSGVSLETVLRRYFTGYALIGDFILEQGEGGGVGPQELIRRLSSVLDELVSAVAEEHSRAAQGTSSTEELRTRRIRRLLAGEISHAPGIGYDIDLVHLGAIASGPEIEMAPIARSLDCRLLLVSYGGACWIWLGSRRGIEPSRLAEHLAELPSTTRVAIGEPAEGLKGWCLTHRQARAAMPIALQGEAKSVCYRDVALLAAVLRDELLATSLRMLYLAPLAGERDGGEALRETVRAYLSARRNVSSAAAVLGVTRNTVAKRLREVEQMVGRDLEECAAEMDAALRLETLREPLLPLR